jgi:ferrous iron transport protein A
MNKNRSYSYPQPMNALPTPLDLPFTSLKLTQLRAGVVARVLAIDCAEQQVPADVGRRLAELGFLPGESVRIVARGLTARDPIAVRIGTGTFALRTFEAACIQVAAATVP